MAVGLQDRGPHVRPCVRMVRRKILELCIYSHIKVDIGHFSSLFSFLVFEAGSVLDLVLAVSVVLAVYPPSPPSA